MAVDRVLNLVRMDLTVLYSFSGVLVRGLEIVSAHPLRPLTSQELHELNDISVNATEVSGLCYVMCPKVSFYQSLVP